MLKNHYSNHFFGCKKEDDKNRNYPLPVIIDGEVQDDVLIQINKDKKWLMNACMLEGYSLEDVFYGFYKGKRLFLIKKENVK